MATAKLTLPDGTNVLIEGTPEEIERLLSFYSGRSPTPPSKPPSRAAKPFASSRKAADAGGEPDIADIVNTIKTCDEAEAIESRILGRDSQVDRVLLPLYIVHQYFGGKFGLTSGHINRVTTELGIPISTPNASATLSSTANRYVIGDKTRRRGRAVRYKMHRRGVEYIRSVLASTSND